MVWQRSWLILCLFFMLGSQAAHANIQLPKFLSGFGINQLANAQDVWLLISDIHFDPFASCNPAHNSCRLIQELRSLPLASWHARLQQEQKVELRFSKDTDQILLNRLLQRINLMRTEYKISTVLILGDFIAHHFKRKYRQYTNDKKLSDYSQFCHHVLTYVTSEIKKNLPNQQVYIIVGNNDSYVGNYVFPAHNSMFIKMSAVISTLTKQDIEQKYHLAAQFKSGGYYALNLPNSSLRLIGLNSNLFSRRAQGRNVKQLAIIELHWFEQQLHIAHKNNQQVLIALHVPPSVDWYLIPRIRIASLLSLWRAQPQKIFTDLLVRYQQNVAGIIAGHLHFSYYHELKLTSAKTLPIIGVPAVSPIFGTRPSLGLIEHIPHSAHFNWPNTAVQAV